MHQNLRRKLVPVLKDGSFDNLLFCMLQWLDTCLIGSKTGSCREEVVKMQIMLIPVYPSGKTRALASNPASYHYKTLSDLSIASRQCDHADVLRMSPSAKKYVT
jgi:hypothetical protein